MKSTLNNYIEYNNLTFEDYRIFNSASLREPLNKARYILHNVLNNKSIKFENNYKLEPFFKEHEINIINNNIEKLLNFTCKYCEHLSLRKFTPDKLNTRVQITDFAIMLTFAIYGYKRTILVKKKPEYEKIYATVPLGDSDIDVNSLINKNNNKLNFGDDKQKISEQQFRCFGVLYLINFCFNNFKKLVNFKDADVIDEGNATLDRLFYASIYSSLLSDILALLYNPRIFFTRQRGAFSTNENKREVKEIAYSLFVNNLEEILYKKNKKQENIIRNKSEIAKRLSVKLIKEFPKKKIPRWESIKNNWLNDFFIKAKVNNR